MAPSTSVDRRQAKSKQAAIRKEALLRLAEVGGLLTAEEDVSYEGTKLVLPESMSLQDAKRFITEKIEEDERTVTFAKTFNYRPWDGAHATMAAIKRAFGMMGQKATKDFFGNDVPPVMMNIPVDVGVEASVPWGDVTLPLLPGMILSLGGTRDAELGTLFTINASGPRKYRFHVEGLFRIIEEELTLRSIYRAKAFDGQEQAQFMDLSSVDPAKVIYSDEVMTQLNANVWTLIDYPERMRQLGVPLKRAVLFHGPYGTGKTLAAYLTAQHAIANGWTFVYCRPQRDDLEAVMATARLYQPSVVFFEDVDIVADAAANHEIERLLDIFDGLQAKGTEIVAVLTTNHVEDIHKGMVRPGRLDAVIEIGDLDTRGVQRLCEAVLPDGALADDIDWVRVHKSMDGYLPAFVREAADRAVRYTVSRGATALGEKVLITTDDLCHAGEGLRAQYDLMEDADDKAVRVPLHEAVERHVQSAAAEAFDGATLEQEDGVYVFRPKKGNTPARSGNTSHN